MLWRRTGPEQAQGAGEERLELVAHDVMQESLLRLAPAVERGGVQASPARRSQSSEPSSEAGTAARNARAGPHDCRRVPPAAREPPHAGADDQRSELGHPAHISVRLFTQR